MATVREIARQVVDALPEDADFSDVDEFLYERAMVEQGRDELAAGKTRWPGRLTPLTDAKRPQVVWSEHAAADFEVTLASSEASSPEEAHAFESAVLQAASSVASDPGVGMTLPEMGDPSIKEVPIGTSHIRYRLLYDFKDRVVRILWFMNNTTCYRNVRG